MKLEVKGILERGVELKVGDGFLIELEFYPSSYSQTHALEISKGFWKVHLYSGRTVTEKTLQILEKGGKEAGEVWTVLRLIKSLSYPTKAMRFQDYLEKRDLQKILKSVWSSVFLQKYSPRLRKDLRYLVRLLVKHGCLSEENIWVKRFKTMETKIFWEKVLTRKWEKS